MIINKLELENEIENFFCTSKELNEIGNFVVNPNFDAYAFVNNCINPNGDIQIVLFDDRKENIEAAKSHGFGWIGYHVTPENNVISRIE